VSLLEDNQTGGPVHRNPMPTSLGKIAFESSVTFQTEYVGNNILSIAAPMIAEHARRCRKLALHVRPDSGTTVPVPRVACRVEARLAMCSRRAGASLVLADRVLRDAPAQPPELHRKIGDFRSDGFEYLNIDSTPTWKPLIASQYRSRTAQDPRINWETGFAGDLEGPSEKLQQSGLPCKGSFGEDD
jgi:hypothetical protein